MRPNLLVESPDDTILCLIISCLSTIDCSGYFLDHIGKSQPDQKNLVMKFQNIVHIALCKEMPDIKWQQEYRPSRLNRDAIDIFGEGDKFAVVIELDKARADQVAKKFVSRFAIIRPPTKIYYISLCYPGTENMNRAECEKYFNYCLELALRMKCHYAGFIIEEGIEGGESDLIENKSESKMSLRNKGKEWLKQNHIADISSPFRVSKYHSTGDLWFFTFPVDFFDSEKSGTLNILLQCENELERFHFLKVPFSFFRDHREKFANRKMDDKFDLHISAKKSNWLSCKRSKGISFRGYEVPSSALHLKGAGLI